MSNSGHTSFWTVKLYEQEEKQGEGDFIIP